MKTQKPERKDWVLLIFIIPIAAFLLLFVGQWAIRVLPFWSVNAGMNSNLEPGSGAAHPFAMLEPLLPQILIPLPWADTYLDPNGDFSFPPFLTFEPTASPAPTVAQPTQTEATPTATAVPTETPTATSIVGTSPTNAGGGGEETPTETATSSSPSSSPTTPSPSATTPSPTATTPSPTATTPSPTATTPPTPVCPGAHNPDGPLPCDYGTVSTPDPSVILNPSPDTNIDVGGSPDGSEGSITDGQYIVLSLQLIVSQTPDNNYDLVIYEFNNGGVVYLDLVIIGISNYADGSQYYEVFNWGNGTPDTNSNVGDVAVANGGEIGDQDIPIAGNNEVPPSETVLYDPDYDPGNPPGIPETNGPLPQTGILIDVDNANSNPPPGTYQFVVIISPPNGGTFDGGNAQVDAIQATEVPIPTP